MTTIIKLVAGNLKAEQTQNISTGEASAGKILTLDADGELAAPVKYPNSETSWPVTLGTVQEALDYIASYKANNAFRYVLDTTTNHNLELDDFTSSTFLDMDNVAANTVTIPNSSTLALPLLVPITIRQKNLGQTEIVFAVGVTVSTSMSLFARTQNSSLSLVQITENEWFLSGDLEAP